MKIKTIIFHLILSAFTILTSSCDIISNEKAIEKYREAIYRDSVLFKDIIQLSDKIEIDSVTYTIMRTRSGLAEIEEDKNGIFLNDENLNTKEFKKSLANKIEKLNLTFIDFRGEKSVVFGLIDRNCDWNHFQLYYLKDTTNLTDNFKQSVQVYDTFEVPENCSKWIYKYNDRWLLYSK